MAQERQPCSASEGRAGNEWIRDGGTKSSHRASASWRRAWLRALTAQRLGVATARQVPTEVARGSWRAGRERCQCQRSVWSDVVNLVELRWMIPHSGRVLQPHVMVSITAAVSAQPVSGSSGAVTSTMRRTEPSSSSTVMRFASSAAAPKVNSPAVVGIAAPS